MKILILIPSYNDNNHLPELIQRICQVTQESILIIDDASKIPVTSVENNVKVLRNKTNLGKGGALNVGFNYASENGYSHVITMDSDLQHEPAKLNAFIDYDKHCELVCGQRIIDKQMPLHRQCSNKLTSWIISKLCGQPIYDSQCGYRRYFVQSVLNLHCSEDGFQFESEVLIKLSQKGVEIGHVIIPTIYGEESSSIRNIQDTFKFIKLILGSLWQKR
ncbi:MAG: glycosyltransferase family 2 protein [Candidatus Marinimicrobia bacterium]|nr:glycosyltransferase family 2 protein [Candidatus Neomarinimicrobiota bacterium]